MKAPRSIKISNTKELLFIKAELKFKYSDHQPTDIPENVVIDATCPTSDLKILLPPQEELLILVQNRFQFGDRFTLDEEFEVDDIQISIYNDALTIKIYADLKEERIK